jgi:hypothetical protein
MGYASQIAESEITAIRAEGIEPTVDEIVWLNDLGRTVENPSGRTDYALAGYPVRCGDVTLWPFSIASGTWFDDVACALFKTDAMQFWCLAYALANARNPDVEWEALNEYDTVRSVVNGWALRCRCTAAELRGAVNRIIPQLSAPHPIKAARVSDEPRPSGLVADLVAGTGLPAEYWRGKPWSFAEECMCAVLAQSQNGIDRKGYKDALYKDACFKFYCAADAVRKAHANG